MISQALLQSLFDYRNGQLFWKAGTRAAKRFGNKPAGNVKADGYRKIGVGKKHYGAHRLVYCFHTGIWNTDTQIDHINGIRDDSRIENLREVERSHNQWNRKINRNSKSGVKGVIRSNGKWKTQIYANGKYYGFGIYNDIQSAAKAVNEGRLKVHGKFANGGHGHSF
jgi:hypothetical protein